MNVNDLIKEMLYNSSIIQKIHFGGDKQMSMKITQAHIDIFKDVFNISSEEEENGVIEKDQDKDPKATQEAEEHITINKSES